MIAVMLNMIAGQQRGAQDIQIPVVGREYGGLVEQAEQQAGVEIVAGPANPEAAVKDSEAFVLVIPREFPEKFRASRPAPVQLVSDSTRESTQARCAGCGCHLVAVQLRDRRPAPDRPRR